MIENRIFAPHYNGNGEFAKNGRKKSSKSLQTYCLCAAALNKLSVTRNITNNATNENTVNSKTSYIFTLFVI